MEPVCLLCRGLFLIGLTLPSQRIDKRMLQGSVVENWMVIIYERQQRFNGDTAQQMTQDLVKACGAVGAPT